MTAASNPGKTRKWLQRVVLAVVIWTAIGLVFALPALTDGRNWHKSLLASLAQWWSWGLLTPSSLLWTKGYRSPASSLCGGGSQLLLSFVFTAAYIYLFAAVLAVMRLDPWAQLLDGKLLLSALRGMFLWSVLVYCLIVGVWQAYLYHQRYLSGELRMERLERASVKPVSMRCACNWTRIFFSTRLIPFLRRWSASRGWPGR